MTIYFCGIPTGSTAMRSSRCSVSMVFLSLSDSPSLFGLRYQRTISCSSGQLFNCLIAVLYYQRLTDSTRSRRYLGEMYYKVHISWTRVCSLLPLLELFPLIPHVLLEAFATLWRAYISICILEIRLAPPDASRRHE